MLLVVCRGYLVNLGVCTGSLMSRMWEEGLVYVLKGSDEGLSAGSWSTFHLASSLPH